MENKEDKLLEKKYKVLTETSPDCIKLFEPTGELIYINPAGISEHRLESLENALNKKWSPIDSVVDSDKEKFKEAMQKATTEGKTTTIEIKHTSEGANREFCLETVAPIKDEIGNVVGIFGVSRDISQIKKTEEELYKIKENLQKQVESRTKEIQEKLNELEKLNKMFVGRELKMVDLKQKLDNCLEEMSENLT